MTGVYVPHAVALGDERLPVRFWKHVEVQANGCWLWSGAIQVRGYGSCWDPAIRKTKLAHRFIYEQTVGPLGPDIELDHLCHTRDKACPGGVSDVHRRCVNPADLEPVDGPENKRRGRSPWAINARRTHCVHDHEFTPRNTRVRPDGRRQCRRCDRAAYEAKQAQRIHESESP